MDFNTGIGRSSNPDGVPAPHGHVAPEELPFWVLAALYLPCNSGPKLTRHGWGKVDQCIRTKARHWHEVGEALRHAGLFSEAMVWDQRNEVLGKSVRTVSNPACGTERLWGRPGNVRSRFKSELGLVTAACNHYPAKLRALGVGAPPVFWQTGIPWAKSPWSGLWIGVVGSRNVSAVTLKFATRIAQEVARGGYGVVSGGAAGVDRQAILAAAREFNSVIWRDLDLGIRNAHSLRETQYSRPMGQPHQGGVCGSIYNQEVFSAPLSSGVTKINGSNMGPMLEILPFGLPFIPKSTAPQFRPARLALPVPGGWQISCRPINEPFSREAAMERNLLIYAVASATVVVHARYKEGGSWWGAISALKKGLGPVLVREDPAEPGLCALIALGGIPISDPSQLFAVLQACQRDVGLFQSVAI